MSIDGTIISFEERKRRAEKAALSSSGPPSQDAIALEFVRLHGAYHRFVPVWHRWIAWDVKRWLIDKNNDVSALIRTWFATS